MGTNKVMMGIRLLGGPSKAATATGVARSTIHVWARQGYVPDENIPTFIRAVKEADPDYRISVDQIRKPINVEAD